MPLAVIKFLDGSGGGQIDNTLPGGIQLPPGAAQLPVFPFDPTIDNSLPSGGGGRPDQSLPGSQPKPDQSLPPGMPPRVDNTLPSGGNKPVDPGYGVSIRPGAKFVVKWLACVGLILVPDNELPSGGSGNRPSQGLPPAPEPKKS